MDSPEALSHQTLQIDNETYYSQMPPEQKQFSEDFIKGFTKVLEKNEIVGAVLGVGGLAKSRPWPRKDQDLLVIFPPHIGPDRKNNQTEIEFAQTDYQFLLNLVKEVVDNNPNIKVNVDGSIEPFIDEEFNSPNLLRHQGTIQIQSDHAPAPIDIIRCDKHETLEEFVQTNKEPFSVLSNLDQS